MAERERVTVIYRSGATMQFTADKFSLTRSTLTGELTGATWTNAVPQPLQFGIDDVSAVFVEVVSEDGKHVAR